MATVGEFDGLKTALARLGQHGVVPAAARPLGGLQDALVAEMLTTVSNEVPAYQASANPDILPELESHFKEVVAAACELLSGGPVGAFEFATSHAKRRAEQKFPLDAILHSYRCVHRVLLRRIRDAALDIADESAHIRRVVAAVSDFVSEFTGVLGTMLTSEYVAYTRVIAEAEGDRRTRLMDTLLSGYDESDQVAARLLRNAGYLEQRQSYCVAIARSVDPREMENPARAQRMADAVTEILAKSPLRHLVSVRDNQVVAIVSGRRRLSGWTAPQSLVADRVYPLLRQVGPAAVIGLSNDVPSTSHIPRAASEARLAIEFANVADRVMPYASIPFRQMLITQARGAVQSALPTWLDAFSAANRKSRGSLLATLRAYADADMNALRAAESLGIHPNTLYARMRRIRDLTALDPLRYHTLTEMLLACECAAIGVD
jgi:hypothetical protein